MGKVLVVGNITLDIVHQLARYPREDEEVRAEAQWQRRGGNAANTAVVLAQQGHQVSFAATLGDDYFARVLQDDMQKSQVNLEFCQHISAHSTPISTINLSQESGSRTIVHFRDLPEYSHEVFEAIPLTEFDWFHFEGRNVPELQQMLARVRRSRIDQPISLEIEKPRPVIETLFPEFDVLVFSRAYARSHRFDTAAALFASVREHTAPESLLVCTWGEVGAYGQGADGRTLHQPATPVARICDSTGAGDTFNAGLIHALLSGQPLPAALAYANELAAKKLQQYGDIRLHE